MESSRPIWIIDDNNIDNFIAKTVLAKSGITNEITCFTDARQALDALKTSTPGLILLDISMPGMSGFEFLDALSFREDPGITPPLIYMLSSSSDPADINRANKHPLVSGYFTKPVTPDTATQIRQIS